MKCCCCFFFCRLLLLLKIKCNFFFLLRMKENNIECRKSFNSFSHNFLSILNSKFYHQIEFIARHSRFFHWIKTTLLATVFQGFSSIFYTHWLIFRCLRLLLFHYHNVTVHFPTWTFSTWRIKWRIKSFAATSGSLCMHWLFDISWMKLLSLCTLKYQCQSHQY